MNLLIIIITVLLGFQVGMKFEDVRVNLNEYLRNKNSYLKKAIIYEIMEMIFWLLGIFLYIICMNNLMANIIVLILYTSVEIFQRFESRYKIEYMKDKI